MNERGKNVKTRLPKKVAVTKCSCHCFLAFLISPNISSITDIEHTLFTNICIDQTPRNA